MSRAGQALEPDQIPGRWKILRLAFIVAGCFLLALLVFLTLRNLDPSASGWMGAKERDVTALVESCERVGPIGEAGVGYWWRCRLVVDDGGGREIRTQRTGIVVDPRDVGRQVELRMACRDETDPSTCTVGRSVPKLVKGLFAMAAVVLYPFLAALGLSVPALLVQVVRNPRGRALRAAARAKAAGAAGSGGGSHESAGSD